MRRFGGNKRKEDEEAANLELKLEASKKLVEQQRKEHESWLEQYNRANDAEKRVKELETEVSNLYKRLADNNDAEGEGNDA